MQWRGTFKGVRTYFRSSGIHLITSLGNSDFSFDVNGRNIV